MGATLVGIVSWMVAHYETLVPGKVTVEADRPAAAGEATFHRMGTPTIDRDDYGLADAEVESLERKRATDIPDSARDGAIQNVPAGLIDGRQVMVEGFPGREIRAHARRNSLDARLLLVKNQIYILIVGNGGEQNRDDKNIRRFFDSFESHGS
jgi:hypothetical protein